MQILGLLSLVAIPVLFPFIGAKTSTFLASVCLVAALMVPRWRKPVTFLALFAIISLSIAAPVDISFQVRPGLPHWVPYVYGLPGRELSRKARRGEVMLGGCMDDPLGPKWVWVW